MMNSTNYCTQWTEDFSTMLSDIKHRLQVQQNWTYWVFHPALNRCWWVLKPLNVNASHIMMLWLISRAKETLFFLLLKDDVHLLLKHCSLVLFSTSLSLFFSLSVAFFVILLFYSIIHALAAHKMVNNLIYVPDQDTSNCSTLRRDQWKELVFFSICAVSSVYLSGFSFCLPQVFSQRCQGRQSLLKRSAKNSNINKYEID